MAQDNNYEWFSPKGVYDWYAPNLPKASPPETPAAQEAPKPLCETPSAAPAPKPRKKHTAMKVTMITVCVLILVVATALAFSEGMEPGWKGDFDFSLSGPGFSIGGDEGDDAEKPATDSDVPDDFFDNFPGFSELLPEEGESYADTDGDDMPDDFREFFNNYYTMEETIEPSSIERGGTGSDFRLELDSSEDMERLSLQQLYSRCSPSVVGVKAFMDDAVSYGWGTGIILNSEGYIVTNAHVISEAKTCTVVLFNGRECEALLVGEDAKTDLAVLKIQAKGLIPASFGNSDELSVGDEVVAIGNPLGSEFSGTLTNGIVSAINRNVDYSGTSLTLIQTNAALNEGNSGGPLINMYGQIIGITNMKMVNNYGGATIEGIGFAIPSTTVKKVADQLIEKGYVTGRPSIGIVSGTVPQQAIEEYGLPEGLYITEVSKGSDAEKKGILPGDVLTHVNGQKVTTTDEVIEIRDEFEVGDSLIMTIFRDGVSFDVVVEIVDSNSIE